MDKSVWPASPKAASVETDCPRLVHGRREIAEKATDLDNTKRGAPVNRPNWNFSGNRDRTALSNKQNNPYTCLAVFTHKVLRGSVPPVFPVAKAPNRHFCWETLAALSG